MPAAWRVAFLLNEQDALWVAGDDPDVTLVLEELKASPVPVFVVVEAPAWSPDWEALRADGYHRVICLAEDTPLWRPDVGAPEAACVGLVPGSDDASVLRDWLEQFVAQAPVSTGIGAALFVDGEPPSVATVDRLRTLAELMGL